MKRYKSVFVVAVAMSVALLAAAGSVRAAYAAGCGSGSQKCAMREGSGACAMDKSEGSSGFLTPYFEMRSLLAQDKTNGLDKLSKNLAGQTAKFRKTLTGDSKSNVPPEQLDALKDIEKAASAMKTKNITVAREGFKGVSRVVLVYVKSYGCDGSSYSFYCDMAKESWLQETENIGNPYYGSQMLKCGVMTGHTMNGKYMAGSMKQ